jgi:hypothetical protein
MEKRIEEIIRKAREGTKGKVKELEPEPEPEKQPKKSTTNIHKVMQEVGRLGGLSKSEAKKAASRENGKKGGRPKKK